eukprot:TRINITY_DN67703_c0_g1_i3.p1 TRINITY_DN67703_c0_g1~~TRINITY_DN67703_c0_g1_i3.p1  ORF type:complete len:262 (+),score=11.57 TRINITY_DN67703_c0_g1_i3:701-1486(+)
MSVEAVTNVLPSAAQKAQESHSKAIQRRRCFCGNSHKQRVNSGKHAHEALVQHSSVKCCNTIQAAFFHALWCSCRDSATKTAAGKWAPTSMRHTCVRFLEIGRPLLWRGGAAAIQHFLVAVRFKVGLRLLSTTSAASVENDRLGLVWRQGLQGHPLCVPVPLTVHSSAHESELALLTAPDIDDCGILRLGLLQLRRRRQGRESSRKPPHKERRAGGHCVPHGLPRLPKHLHRHGATCAIPEPAGSVSTSMVRRVDSSLLAL